MLLKLRQYRVGLVQTAEQLRFSYLAIIEGIIKLYPEAFEGLNERNEGNSLTQSLILPEISEA